MDTGPRLPCLIAFWDSPFTYLTFGIILLEPYYCPGAGEAIAVVMARFVFTSPYHVKIRNNQLEGSPIGLKYNMFVMFSS